MSPVTRYSPSFEGGWTVGWSFMLRSESKMEAGFTTHNFCLSLFAFVTPSKISLIAVFPFSYSTVHRLDTDSLPKAAFGGMRSKLGARLATATYKPSFGVYAGMQRKSNGNVTVVGKELHHRQITGRAIVSNNGLYIISRTSSVELPFITLHVVAYLGSSFVRLGANHR